VTSSDVKLKIPFFRIIFLISFYQGSHFQVQGLSTDVTVMKNRFSSWPAVTCGEPKVMTSVEIASGLGMDFILTVLFQPQVHGFGKFASLRRPKNFLLNCAIF
jgi:hypothetical protein